MLFMRKIAVFNLICLALVLSACTAKEEIVPSTYLLNACLSDPAVCNETDLCRLAVYEEDGDKRWYEDNLRWQPYVAEAKQRKLNCGLSN